MSRPSASDKSPESLSGLELFRGTERFETRRQLGSGTAGVVYEAWDRERGCAVALKLLHQSDPASLYRFKQEFRALVDLSHPNLIQLYELQKEGDQWFVTMELIDGVDFVRYVRDPQALEQGAEALERRFLPAARQLARGLRALHASGRLHRDIKPSNVLVNREGNVVLLDFGLVTKPSAFQTFQSITEDILGTPAYMAPEQGGETNLTEAADWYGVGTLFYESLTGKPPFTGQFVQVMLAKQRSEPPPPRQLLPGISADLDELCCDLLRRDVDLRPEGGEVLERLGAADEAAYRTTWTQGAPVLVGRDDHMARLGEAFLSVLSGGAEIVYVHGAAGLGKTALVQRFLWELRQEHPDTVTLSGRCYEHESVPYKAFDSLIDMLTRYLRSLPDERVRPLLPRDVLALARLFPVLLRVPSIAIAERKVLEIRDSLELRRRAFAVLREILMRLSEDDPLVLFLDDLQWGDADSAELLVEVTRGPDPPPLLLIGAYRDEASHPGPMLQELRSSLLSAPTRVAGQELEVGELAPEASKELTRRRLESLAEEGRQNPGGGGDVDGEEAVDTIAREAGGNPLFIEELVRFARDFGRLAAGGLDEALEKRLVELPEGARRLLEILALAGQPIEIDVARKSAQLASSELSAFTVLRAGNLARSTGGRGHDRIEIFHDRVRRAVLLGVGPKERREGHRRLARELEMIGRFDPEALAHHFAEAGEDERALEYATEAAESSARALAFNRAARLYRLALDMGCAVKEQERALRLSLAEALVNAGRSAAAAEIYLRLARGAKAAEALEMRRRAAERWLVSGHIDQGLDALRDVLGAVGWKLAPSPRRALPGLLLGRARLRLRGLAFSERDITQVSAEELCRIDICWSASIGLGVVDPIRGAAFQARHLLLALAAGEPFRVARALAMEVAYTAARGGRFERTRKLLAAAEAIVDRLPDPYILGLATFSSGLVAYLQGRFRNALDDFEKAELILRERSTGVAWEIDNIHFYSLMTLVQLGRVEEFLRRLPLQLDEAHERGDLYASTNIRARVGWFADLAEGDPERASRRLDAAIGAWSRRGFHLQHLWSHLGRVEIHLYLGEGRRAWDEISSRFREIERSLFLRVQNLYLDCHALRARAALAAAGELHGASRREVRRLLLSARRDAARVRRRDLPFTKPLSALLEAAVAATEGRRPAASRLIARAEEAFDTMDMALYAAVARYRRGQLAGSGEGEELVARARTWMEGQGIRDPDRTVGQMAPGIWNAM